MASWNPAEYLIVDAILKIKGFGVVLRHLFSMALLHSQENLFIYLSKSSSRAASRDIPSFISYPVHASKALNAYSSFPVHHVGFTDSNLSMR